jgi:hypothetical protein
MRISLLNHKLLVARILFFLFVDFFYFMEPDSLRKDFVIFFRRF